MTKIRYMYRLFPFLLVLILCGCQENKQLEETSELHDSIRPPSGRIISQIGTPLIPEAKEAIAEWEEYQNVDEFILRFYSISIEEAKTSARELADLVVIMRDSIRLPILTEPNMLARFNVFKTEVLRLSDMATISAISDEELKFEVQKVLEVYDAVNAKINTIFNTISLQEKLEVDTEVPVEEEEDPSLRPTTFDKNRNPKAKPTLGKKDG